MNKKWQGFMVIELMVVMLISTVSIGIAYATYRIVSGQFQQYQYKSNEVAEYVLLDKVLLQDIALADRMVRTPDGVRLDQHSTPAKIHYRFEEEYVIREKERLDTFRVMVKEWQTFFDHKPENITDATVEELIFLSDYKGEELPFHYQRPYGAEMMINSERR